MSDNELLLAGLIREIREMDLCESPGWEREIKDSLHAVATAKLSCHQYAVVRRLVCAVAGAVAGADVTPNRRQLYAQVRTTVSRVIDATEYGIRQE